MKTTEVNKNLIGRRCECIFTGMMVTGVIEDIEENKYSVNVKVHFDKPQQWGDDLYTEDWAWGARRTSSAHCTICDCWQTNRTFRR